MLTFFPKRLGISNPNYHTNKLSHVSIYAGLQTCNFDEDMPLPYSKRDHYHMLKMSTIGRNARWVVALNMA